MRRKGFAGSGGLLLTYGALSLAAVLLGAFVAASHGVATGTWVRTLLAWAVGAALASAIAAALRPGALPFVPGLALAGLLATLFSAPQEGVHRWVDLGPMSINVAMLVLPAAAGAAAALMPRRPGWALGGLMLSAALLVVQPDASQATTLALAGIALALLAVPQRGLRVVAILAFAALACGAWFRPDSLQPVPEVEEILALAFDQSPALAALALLLLAAIAAVPVVLSRTWRTSTPAIRGAGLGLGLCFAGWAITPFLGHFPVPFVGMGMSPVLGGWLGIGLFAGLLRLNRNTMETAPGTGAVTIRETTAR
jgi:cell division protein FtsW (lipid II flippase)